MYKVAEDFTPNPINLLESNRSLGYSIEEAVSDLIDNSISAKAKNISINLSWGNAKPYFVLFDDYLNNPLCIWMWMRMLRYLFEIFGMRVITGKQLFQFISAFELKAKKKTLQHARFLSIFNFVNWKCCSMLC